MRPRRGCPAQQTCARAGSTVAGNADGKSGPTQMATIPRSQSPQPGVYQAICKRTLGASEQIYRPANQVRSAAGGAWLTVNLVFLTNAAIITNSFPNEFCKAGRKIVIVQQSAGDRSRRARICRG